VEAYSILEGLIRNRRAVEISPTAAKRPAERPAAAVEDYDAVKWNRAPEFKLRAGDWVEVRPKEEILETLDKNGCLEELPFMPQMFQYCGQRFQVFKRAHKTCDPIYSMAGRKLENAVHLELRCDGKAHGGCQVGCLLFWKDAWLRSLKEYDPAAMPARAKRVAKSGKPTRCTEQDVFRATSRADVANGETYTRYVCQTTQLPEFTKPLPWWSPAQYVEDYRSGNTTLPKMARGLFYSIFVRYPTRLAPARYIYNSLQALIGGTPSPVDWGKVPGGRAHPYVDLKLEPGDLVRVKTHQRILTTLDRRNKNRGLYFDVEMVPFCGRVYRVRSRVDRFIDEKTGKMMSLKTPAVILEGAFCGSHLSKRRMFCPRGLHSWWREVWLERVSEAAIDDADLAPCKTLQLQAARLNAAQDGA
jgi:hypothetical protein